MRLTSTLFVSMVLCAAAIAGPIPVGYTCTGNCGTLGADGVVTLSPFGSPAYMYVSTDQGLVSTGALLGGNLGGETNGSRLVSPVFSANSGETLAFYFNYVTSDGSGFADYAWAALANPDLSNPQYLVTARTTPNGSIIPGFGMPGVSSTLTPASVPIIGGGPAWSALGGSSGSCFAAGCGYTGWVKAEYVISASGSYVLAFGTANWSDQAFDSGLAIDGATIAGKPIDGGQVPEPATLGLIGFGLGAVALLRRRLRM